MKTKSLVLHLIFILIMVLVLIGTVYPVRWLDYPVKPLIMIWIAVYFLMMTKPQPFRWMVLLAFLFSWLGDLLLMFGSKSDMLFFAGVGGFFLSQVTYIQAFRKFSITRGKGQIARKPLWALPFLVYMVGLYIFLKPGLDSIMKPVVVLYAISLLGMSAAAFNRMGLTDPGSFRILFSGSLLFVISDTLLAINKFGTPIPNEGFLVMGTYMLAQYLIMMGLLSDGKTLRREDRRREDKKTEDRRL